MNYSVSMNSLMLNAVSKIVSIVLVLSVLVFSGCKKSNDPKPIPSIDSFTPASGKAGTPVTINGLNFSATSANNIVTFNGTAAEIIQASTNQIIALVPAGATTGKIAVTMQGLMATSATDFTVLTPPTISSFTPTFHDQSTSLPTVTITGTNFSSTLADNVVKFNGTAATLTNATTTQLTMTLPSAATSGKITVTTQGVTATSDTDFLVGCPDVIITDITVSNVSGNMFDVTYHIKNIGGVPLDINDMFFQGYLSKTKILAGEFVGAGGGPVYGALQTYDLLAPNATLELNRTSINAGSITTYPYIVVQIGRGLNGPIECDTDNNFLGQQIQ